MTVIKRNGSIEKFSKQKIIDSIKKANSSLSKEFQITSKQITRIAIAVATSCIDLTEPINIDKIEDLVEEKMMEAQAFELAKSYIKFRYRKELIRKSNTTDESIKELIEGSSEYWNTENSNKDAKVVTTQRDYLAGITSTDISKRLLLPKDVVDAHDAGIIHFHDMDYFAQNALNNCFHGHTKLVTDKGVRPFNSFYDGDVIKVKDLNGIWRKATIHTYGKQNMVNVVFRAGRSVQNIVCTRNHRWVLRDGSITTNLNVGDTLWGLQCSTYFDLDDDENKEYFAYGFILGDGTDITNSIGCSVRLCGDKVKHYSLFKSLGYCENKISGSTDVIMYRKDLFSKSNFIANKCWKLLTMKQKIALFNGYYAADGFKYCNGIATSNDNLAEMIEDISAIAGYYITSHRFQEHRKTKYSEDSSIHTYRFVVHQPPNKCWKVESISSYYGNSEFLAWCVEEPITHTFTLANGIVTGNCCLINLNDMLQNGTMINGVKIDKPHRLLTATTIATQIITAVASSQYGGCSINLADLAPFVRMSHDGYVEKYLKRGMSDSDSKKFANEDTLKEIVDSVQTFNYQINSMSTTNGQAPFLTVFMYLNQANEYKDELAMLIEEFLNQRILGMKNKNGVYVTPAFTKLIYVLEEDNITKGSKYWYLTELSAKCTSKRMVPDYISEKVMKKLKVNGNGDGDCYSVMGCRSALTPDKTGNGYNNIAKALDYEPGKPKYSGRFNQGVVTINLADVALSSGKDMDKFWKIFDERLELCHRALQVRHKRLSKVTSDVAPILWQHGAFARLEPGESVHPLLHGGYSTISLGYAALYECVKYMTGESHTAGKGKEFGLKVMQHMNDKCAEWKEVENIDYSLYGTPIESTTYKFAKCLQKRFGIIPGITDKDYITNSYHVHVTEKIDAFEKLRLESEFQRLSPGGAISYVETPDLTKNVDAVLSLMQFIYDNIMYAELNCKSDYCMNCGYDGEIEIQNDLTWKCPNCGNTDQSKMSVTRRTCGYLGSHYWNKGRTQEIKERVLHLDNFEHHCC